MQADFPSFSLAKLLDHLPKASPQGLFPYLATASLPRQHNKVQQSRIFSRLLPNQSSQDLPTDPNIDSPFCLLKDSLLQKHLLSVLVQARGRPSPFWASERRVLFRKWAASSLLPDCGSDRTTRCLLFPLSSHSRREELDPQTVSQNKTSSLRCLHQAVSQEWEKQLI